MIRNIFLYAIPGGLFVAIGLVSRRITLAQVNALLGPYHPPTWALGLLLIVACYLAGHLLFAIASLRVEFWQLVHWGNDEWLAKYPAQVTARDLIVRHYFPDLFREMDRREASSRFVFSSIAALLIGWLIFLEFQPAFADVIIGAAVLVFIATVTWMTQLGRIRAAIHAAGSEIEAREKSAREAEAIIQPSPDELRFVIDSIFKAAELTSQKRRSFETEGQPVTADTTPSGNGSAEQPPSTARSAPTFGLKL
ncbi:MAG: hypothetical protein ACRD8A_18255 [Candidatus Acidiferrales bacterium]